MASRPPRIRLRILTVRRVVVTALFVSAILGGCLLGVFLAVESDLPEITSLEDFQPNIITQIFAADGSVLGEFAIEKRVVIAFRDIPPVLRNAIVAVEDADFWKHIGINPWRVPGGGSRQHPLGAARAGILHPHDAIDAPSLPDAREDAGEEDQGDHPRVPDREELHEGRDLHAVLQPGEPRSRQLRGRGGEPLLLRKGSP